MHGSVLPKPLSIMRQWLFIWRRLCGLLSKQHALPCQVVRVFTLCCLCHCVKTGGESKHARMRVSQSRCRYCGSGFRDVRPNVVTATDSCYGGFDPSGLAGVRRFACQAATVTCTLCVRCATASWKAAVDNATAALCFLSACACTSWQRHEGSHRACPRY